jgi:pantoate--beta-alanine ligase
MGAVLVSSLQWERFTGGTVRSWNDAAGKIKLSWSAFSFNPSQFNDPSDLERYPRTLDQDLALLQSLGVDEVIVPSVRELYPNGYRFRVEPHGSDLVLEGAHRPGFLQGVMTVVLKLLNLVRADHAYFGEKDY